MLARAFLFASTVPILIVVRIQLIRMVVPIILRLHRLHLLPALLFSCTCCLRNDRHCCQSQELFDFCRFHIFTGCTRTG
jgi:hypothetical protein